VSTTIKDLVDAHGNMVQTAHGNTIIQAIHKPILSPFAGRVAEAKEIRRIKKLMAQRRRAGEEVLTDDEIPSANERDLERDLPSLGVDVYTDDDEIPSANERELFIGE